MGYLLHILIAVGALGAAESELAAPILPAVLGWLPLPLFYALTLAIRRAALAGRFSLAERLLRLSALQGPLAFAFAGLACGWIEWVRARLGTHWTPGWPSWTGLVALLPYVLWQLVAIDAHARALGLDPRRRGRHLRFQRRMFAAAFVPVLLYISVYAAVGSVEAWRVPIERIGLLYAGFLCALILPLGWMLPRLLARIWRTEPMPDGPIREVMRAVAARADFRARDLLVWHTEHTMTNAAIVGLSPRSRIVLFSDSLLSMLSLRELAAVLGHEIGHAVRHHVTIFLAWSVAFFLAADRVTSWIDVQDPWLYAALWLAWIAIWFALFGWLSRRYELDADLYSLEIVGDGAALSSALERVGGRLRDVAGWRHFSPTARARFLARATRDPEFARRFRTRWRRVGRLGMLAAVVALAAEVHRLWQVLPEDRVFVELALGRYQRARARAEAAAGVEAGEAGAIGAADESARSGDASGEDEPALDPELLALTRLAADYQVGLGRAGEAVALEALLEDLFGALARLAEQPPGPAEGWEGALALARLAGMRGAPRAFDLASEIERVLTTAADEAGERGARPDRAPAIDSRAAEAFLEALPSWREWFRARYSIG